MLVLSSCGHKKPWSFKKHLPFYWGIRDLCGAYYWRQQISSEFWNYILQVGLDVSQNLKVVIIKKKDGSILCNILVCKSENGDNVIINFYIPLGNTWNMVQHMHNMQISWDFNNDEVRFVLRGLLQEFNTFLVIESNRNK
jgi:hypothetical protein